MLLLQQKADISVDIYIVPEPDEEDDTKAADTEAASKVAAVKKTAHSSESSDMDDDDDERDNDEEVSQHSSSSSDEEAAVAEKRKKKKKKPAWIWQPMKAKEKPKQIVSYSIFQVKGLVSETETFSSHFQFSLFFPFLFLWI